MVVLATGLHLDFNLIYQDFCTLKNIYLHNHNIMVNKGHGHHLYVVVAVLGEEQELDLSPLRKRLALGPPARGLSGV